MGGWVDGPVVVVTGGPRGIGDAIVRRVAAEDTRVVVPALVDPDAPVAGTRHLHRDITDRHAVAAAHASIEAQEGRLDVLVDNAGIQRVSLTDQFDPYTWEQVVHVHLFGAFYWSRLALSAAPRCRP